MEKIDILMGNQAIARAAIESGAKVITGYPGTPSTEIIETLLKWNPENVHVEWSVNEKVAIDIAASAAFTGTRAMVTMKSVGLNVASDPLNSICLVGVEGGLVIVSADDPGAYSSQNEQDNRYYALLSNIPMLEPSTAKEAKEMTKKAFELSEELKLPVILRTTHRVAHTSEDILIEEPEMIDKKPRFSKDRKRYYLAVEVPTNRHRWQLEQMQRAEMLLEKYDLNKFYPGREDICVITSGIAYNYLMEALSILELKDQPSIFKLGCFNPLPLSPLKEILNKYEKILVIEELEPILEMRIRAICEDSTKISGKKELDIPRVGELSTEKLIDILKTLENKNLINERRQKLLKISKKLPKRMLTMCAGCPHRATLYALKKIVGDNIIVAGDIGCYGMGSYPPLEVINTSLCMGSSIGNACGMSIALKEKVIAVIGDSTFFHSGFLSLTNAAYYNMNIALLICDNQITAMTGGQLTVGDKINLKKMIESLGIEFVKVVDPYDLPLMVETLKKAVEYKGLSVVIARRECAIEQVRKFRREKIETKKFTIDQNKCKKCKICIDTFGCPAIRDMSNKIEINKDDCTGCGVCVNICPFDAIRRSD